MKVYKGCAKKGRGFSGEYIHEANIENILNLPGKGFPLGPNAKRGLGMFRGNILKSKIKQEFRVFFV